MLPRAITIIFGLGMISLSAHAQDSEDWGPKNGYTVGPSLGWAGGGTVENAFAGGVEATYFHKIKMPLNFWVSGGARMWASRQAVPVIPYLETGLSLLLLNFGAGYGPIVNHGDIGHSIHMFVGVNIPIWHVDKNRMIYIEPYYRPTWDVSSDSILTHETGLMVKWFAIIKRD